MFVNFVVFCDTGKCALGLGDAARHEGHGGTMALPSGNLVVEEELRRPNHC